MPRKRTELTHAQETEIKARTERGESAATIFAAVPGLPSVPTIARRQAELRAGTQAQAPQPAPTGPRASLAPVSAGPPSTSEPEVPDEVPEGTPIEQIDRWVRMVEKAMTTAAAQSNLAALASLAQKLAALAALRHRHTPLPKPDPAENPDFKALAAQGRERLRKLTLGLFDGDNGGALAGG